RLYFRPGAAARTLSAAARAGSGVRLGRGADQLVLRPPVSHQRPRRAAAPAAGRRRARLRHDLRPRCLSGGCRQHAADSDRTRPPDGAQKGRLMELLLAIAIGLLTGCGVFLLLRARTFPVILGLSLISYAV